MNALTYLVRRQVRNFFRGLIRHPSKLVIYLLAVAFFVLMIMIPQKTPQAVSSYSDLRLLESIFFGWLLLISAPLLFSSLKSGTTMFSMSDVDLLFVSPIPPKKILFYGLMKQTAATLFGFVFFLFYSGTIMRNFRVGASGIVWMLLASALLVLVIQVTSLLLYSFSNGSAKRKSAVRAVLFACFGALALATVSISVRSGNSVEGLYAAVDSPWVHAFPFVGWLDGAVFAVIRGDMGAAVFWAALTAAGFALVVVILLRSDADYYEDVLQTTETLYEAKQAAQENRPAAVNRSGSGKVRVGDTGIGKGWGANAFFYKHLCEARRHSRLVFLGRSSFVMLAVNLVLVFAVMRPSHSGAPTSTHMMMTLLGADVYILFLTNAVGDWTRELSKPYIYLVPADPFRKLMWASLTTALKPVANGALFFAADTIFTGASAFAGLGCFLAYSSVGLLFLAGNILSQRVFGGLAKRGVVVFLYLFILTLLMAPGIAGGVIVFRALPSASSEALRFFAGSLVGTAWNLLASLFIVFCCRNLLADTEGG